LLYHAGNCKGNIQLIADSPHYLWVNVRIFVFRYFIPFTNIVEFLNEFGTLFTTTFNMHINLQSNTVTDLSLLNTVKFNTTNNEVIISRTITADNYICFNSICIWFEKLFDKFIHHIVAVMNGYSPVVWDNHRHIKYAGIKKNGKATGISNDCIRFFLMYV